MMDFCRVQKVIYRPYDYTFFTFFFYGETNLRNFTFFAKIFRHVKEYVKLVIMMMPVLVALMGGGGSCKVAVRGCGDDDCDKVVVVRWWWGWTR